jgi:hypothetical protein
VGKAEDSENPKRGSGKMDFIIILVVVILVSSTVNLLHWQFRAGEKFQYTATQGPMLALQVALIIALVIFSILFLVGMVSGNLTICLAFATGFFNDIYSIRSRHHQRRDQKAV